MAAPINSADRFIRLGDDVANKQYRGILHFDTSSLPDNAVITSVKVKVKQDSIVGTNPFATHGNLVVDIQKPYFGTTASLTANDFQAASGQAGIAIFDSTPVSSWYTANLDIVGFPYINLTSTTQFRLAFTLDDNNDFGADYMSFFSGDDMVANRPQLIIEYYVP